MCQKYFVILNKNIIDFDKFVMYVCMHVQLCLTVIFELLPVQKKRCNREN